MKLYRQIDSLLTLQGAAIKQGRNILDEDLSVIKRAAFIEERGKIIWLGEDKKIPKNLKVKKEINLKGKTLLPGLIDCHTHLVFAGNRMAEFELRNRGASYQEIAKAGGGILSTMRATRKISAKSLLSLAQQRADLAVKFGVTTIEVKSGYALNEKDELKQLAVAQKIKGPRIITTFLGAHAKPPEFENYDAYLEYLIEKVLPQVKKKKLANRCDIFIEKGFFENPSAQKYLQKAKMMGFDLVVHADQLSLSGGTVTAVNLGALSADHVIQIGKAEIALLAKSETTAVCLPAADLYMKCAYPPAREMLNQGVRVALASDFNPGSSPTQDINLVGLLSRLYMQMTLPEVIVALTLNAAYALKIQNEIGSLQIGKAADFVVTEKPWQELFYQIGENWVDSVYLAGRRL